ncbi:Retrovirus-related Pol polyprotein from transposon 17.6, partial [Trichinella sp. T8]
MVRMNRASDGATNGERSRMSENPRWIMPPEALTRSSDVERWFIRMERYFRAADVPDNRRAAMVQYHMDEAMGDVLSALEVEETDDYDKLKSTLFRVFGTLNIAFPQLKDQADGILLQQFEAGIRQDMIKFTILRSDPVANCLRIRQSSIQFTKPLDVAPVGTKSANSRSQLLVAMEQMLPKEQEAGGKYRPTLSAILEQFSDVLATSDEDLGRMSVMCHAIHTGDAKPIRCSPRRIACHQRAQVEMETRDREKTAFTTPYGLYQFKVKPFGLFNAPATIQRLMETSLRGLVGSKCLVYLEDMTETFCRTAEEHTTRLQDVLDRLRKVGLKVKPEKRQLMKRKVAYLGHIISEKGIATDPSKTRAVKEWQAPSCVSELRQFLGLA